MGDRTGKRLLQKPSGEGEHCELEPDLRRVAGVRKFVGRSDMRRSSKASNARASLSGFPVPCGENWALRGGIGNRPGSCRWQQNWGLAPGTVPCVGEVFTAYRERQSCLKVTG